MPKKLDEYYKKNLPSCLTCGNNQNVIRCVYGKPSKDLIAYASTNGLLYANGKR